MTIVIERAISFGESKVLILSPLLGTPRMQPDVAVPPCIGPALILSPLLGTPENAGVM